MDIILASESKRRIELLNLMGIDFRAVKSNTDENIPACPPQEYTMRLAHKKAADVALRHESDCVIGADTIVVLDGKIIGKPVDKNDAYNTLSMLSGKTHTVYTGVAVVCGDNSIVRCDKTDVTFAKLSDKDILDYISTGDPFDKAGSYGVQGPFCVHIESINGSFFNVMGLPVHLLYNMLKELKVID